MNTRNDDVWSEGLAPYILSLDVRSRGVVSFKLRSLYPAERATAARWLRGCADPSGGMNPVDMGKSISVARNPPCTFRVSSL
jgi:hypothetical protein